MKAWKVITPWSVGMLAGVCLGLLSQTGHAGGVTNDNRHNYNNTVSRDDSVEQSNQQVVNGGSVEVAGDSVGQSVEITQRKQSPSMAISASGPCVGAGAGASLPGIGLQGITVDEECSKREAARLAYQLGDHELAYKLLGSLEAVKNLNKPAPVEVNAHGWPVEK